MPCRICPSPREYTLNPCLPLSTYYSSFTATLIPHGTLLMVSLSP